MGAREKVRFQLEANLLRIAYLSEPNGPLWRDPSFRRVPTPGH